MYEYEYYEEKPFADGEDRYTERDGFIIGNRAFRYYDEAVTAYIEYYFLKPDRAGTEEAIRALKHMVDNHIRAKRAASAEGGAK